MLLLVVGAEKVAKLRAGGMWKGAFRAMNKSYLRGGLPLESILLLMVDAYDLSAHLSDVDIESLLPCVVEPRQGNFTLQDVKYKS